MKAILDSIAKIEAWNRGEEFAPWEIEIYPTNRCNLRCLFCLQRVEKYDYSAELPTEKWLQIIRQGAALGVEAWVLLGGGEPFARKEVTLPIIREIKRLGMHGTLITNGLLISKELVEELIARHWDSILFSLETDDAKTQDRLMDHPGAFKTIVATIENFSNEKARRRLALPRLVLQPTITSLNVDHLWGLHRLCHSIGVEFLCFKTFEAFTPEARQLRLTAEQKTEFFTESLHIKAWADLVGLRTNVHQFRDRRQKCNYLAINQQLKKFDERVRSNLLSILCHMPWRKMTIKADGGVEPCVGINRGGVMGARSLKDIWLSADFDAIRRELYDRHQLRECALCGYGIPVTTFEKLKYINQVEAFPELSVFDLEIVAG